MRISGGSARGIPLRVPATGTRPATDRLREAVFSSLGPRVVEARVLDLFAGAGSYGLEALSRGAAAVTFVEKHPPAAALLRANLQAVERSMGAGGRCVVRVADVFTLPVEPGHDLLFIDPPYAMLATHGPRLMDLAARWVTPGGDATLVFEMPGEVDLPAAAWHLVRRIGKGRGQPTACLYRLRAPQGELQAAP
jgi:16S rRNA (guanine966-N2)-methyltransferase